jgi:hypothetical protein
MAVITLRSSPVGGGGGGAVTMAVPHAKQKRASAGFSVPHEVQNGMQGAYARLGALF